MRLRAGLTFCLAVAVSALLAAAVPNVSAWAGEAAPMPLGEQRLQTRGLAPPPELPPRPVNPRRSSRLLFEEEEPLTAFDYDRGLSKLCRAGRFRQQRAHLYTVRLGGYLHGAVIGGRWGLYDPEGLAVPRLVYALRWQDSGRCEVYILRHLNPGELAGRP
ncbi:MAG: hypothetical protein Tsb0032_42960 [Kiloniellaceae bacterium]